MLDINQSSGWFMLLNHRVGHYPGANMLAGLILNMLQKPLPRACASAKTVDCAGHG